MSDRVVFGTNLDTLTPANSSGFNGFPFGPVTGVTPPTLRYPVKISFDDSMKWLWRVKTWSLSTDAVQTSVPIVNGVLAPAPAFTREREMAAPPPASVQRRAHTVGEFSLVADEAAFAFHLFSEFDQATSTGFNGLRYLQNLDRTCWPALALYGRITTGGHQLVFSSTDSTLASGGGSIVATVDGKAVTTYYRSSGGGTISGLVLTPAEYWAYAGKDGLPIYDTATGALLPDRDPDM